MTDRGGGVGGQRYPGNIRGLLEGMTREGAKAHTVWALRPGQDSEA